MPRKSISQTSDFGEILFTWEFREFPSYQRSALWYFLAFLAIVGLVIYSIATRNFLFLILIVIFAVIMILRITRQAPMVKSQITEDGIVVGESFTSYKDIRSFWFFYEPKEAKTLYFEFKSHLRPRLGIPLEKQSPVEIREVLLNYLTEEANKEHEPFSDALGRIFKL